MKKYLIGIAVLIIAGGLFYLFYDDGSYNFTAEVDGISVKGISSFAQYSGGKLSIYTILDDDEKKGIIIFVHASETGNYFLGTETESSDRKENYGQYHYGDEGNRIHFLSKGQYTGKCKISKLDLSDKKVSGNFEFDAIESFYAPTGRAYSSRVIHVTRGKFENVRIN